MERSKHGCGLRQHACLTLSHRRCWLQEGGPLRSSLRCWFQHETYAEAYCTGANLALDLAAFQVRGCAGGVLFVACLKLRGSRLPHISACLELSTYQPHTCGIGHIPVGFRRHGLPAE